jgi:hypothetical protein
MYAVIIIVVAAIVGRTAILGYGFIFPNSFFESSLPHVEIIACHDSAILDSGVTWSACEQWLHFVPY